MKGAGKSENIGRGIKYILLNLFILLIAVSVLVPIIYMVLISFSKNFLSMEAGVLPKEYTLQNYRDLFEKHTFTDWLKNSIIISMGTMALALILTTMSSYAFSKMKFAGRNMIFKSILLIQIFPLALSMVAIHQIFNRLGLINKPGGLILVNSVMATIGLILISKGYFDTLPAEIEEAALIDGANRFVIFARIVLPMVKPMMAVIAIQSFVLAYNEYVIANVVMTGGFKTMPLAVGLRSMFEGQYGINWPRYCAAALLGSLPMVMVFFCTQRYFITGLTEGGVKE